MTQTTTMDAQRKRLVYQSNHRGCKEMDLIFSQFCARHVADMDEQAMTLYAQLLDEDDWDIYAWLNDRGELDAKYAALKAPLMAYTPLAKQQAS